MLSVASLYLWLKAFHVMAVITWMAALFYLPRLFIYHFQAEARSQTSETFKIMESRLALVIMTPAMVASWASGLAVAYVAGYFSDPQTWLAIKLVAVAGLTVLHLVLLGYTGRFAADQRPRSERYFRALNEIPTLLMIVIVVMVVVKPFV